MTFPVATAALLILSALAPVRAAIRSSPSYTVVSESFDPGGAVFSPSYANRSALVAVSGVSSHTIPDAPARFLWHGFVPTLDAPLFAVANLSLTLEASPLLSSPQEPIACSGTVTNHGPDFAPGVTLTLTLPDNIRYLDATVSQGSVGELGQKVRCNFGVLPAGGVAAYSLRVTPTANGPALLDVAAIAEAVDLDFGGNSASARSTVVSAARFTGAINGMWLQAGNWSPPGVPGESNKVFITQGTVDYWDVDATVAGLVLSGGRISSSRGARSLTVSTLASWTGGEINGLKLVIPAGGLLEVTNGSAVNLRSDAGIVNHGTVRLDSTALQSVAGGWVTNYGLFEIVGQRSFLRFENTSFNFHNANGAIFRKSAGDGVSSIPIAFRNEGVIEVLAGGMEFNASFINGGINLYNYGPIRAAAGVEIRYTKANSFRDGTFFEGPGRHRIIAASMAPDDGSEFFGSVRGNFEIANGRMAGIFTNTGHLEWTGGDFRLGSLTIPESSSLTVRGSGRTLLFGFTIRNFGALLLAGGGLNQFGGGAVDNHGLLDIGGDFGLDGLAFTNRVQAYLRKSAGTGTTAARLEPFQNDGTIEVRSGVFALGGDYAPGPTARLVVYVGGTAPFGRFTATGVAKLNGELLVISPLGFAPLSSDSFEIVTALRREGTFSALRENPGWTPVGFNAEYLPQGVLLKLAPVPGTFDAQSLRYFDGDFYLKLRGGPGGVYILQATEKLGPLANWVPISTNTGAPEGTQFIDSGAEAYPARFYRTLLAPRP